MHKCRVAILQKYFDFVEYPEYDNGDDDGGNDDGGGDGIDNDKDDKNYDDDEV